MNAQTQIANYLNIEETALTRCEEWAFVWFVVVTGRGARFISKKVVRKMANANIEYVNGKESHTSNWGKYYVKGLESWEVKEDFSENRHDNHNSYQGYVCLDVPEGTLFTIFEQNGNKRGTDVFIFSICRATAEKVNSDAANYGSGFCQGNYEILVSANTKTLAPRLMGWWIDSPDKSLAFAKHCEAHIGKRGLKTLPAMEKI
jgi:hypothetical protein